MPVNPSITSDIHYPMDYKLLIRTHASAREVPIEVRWPPDESTIEVAVDAIVAVINAGKLPIPYRRGTAEFIVERTDGTRAGKTIIDASAITPDGELLYTVGFECEIRDISKLDLNFGVNLPLLPVEVMNATSSLKCTVGHGHELPSGRRLAVPLTDVSTHETDIEQQVKWLHQHWMHCESQRLNHYTKQSFVMNGVEILEDGREIPIYSLLGTWYQDRYELSTTVISCVNGTVEQIQDDALTLLMSSPIFMFATEQEAREAMRVLATKH